MARQTIRAGVLVALLTNYASAERYFMGLGFLPGGTQSQALHISPNGQYVVGWDPSGATSRFLWTQGSGMLSLGAFEGVDVSDNGIVVGSSNFVPSRWTQGGGDVPLGNLPGNPAEGFATGISADGSTIVGTSAWNGQSQAFRWTQANGMVGLGLLSGALESTATVLSDDSTYIAGTSRIGAPGNQLYNRVFGYDGSLSDLGFPGSNSNGPHASVYDVAVTGAGPIIVGDITNINVPAAPISVAFARLANGLTALALPMFPNTIDGSTFAYCVSGDGSIVLGSSTATGSTQQVGVMWTAQGIRTLKDVLTSDYGLDLSGWQEIYPRDMTPDGNYIVGWGYRVGSNTPEGFITFIPEPATVTVTLFTLLVIAGCRRATCKR